MRHAIAFLALLALPLLVASGEAEAKSCSSFAKITAYDADASTVTISYEKGKEREYFPKPEGTPRDTSKIPEECKRRVKKQTTFPVMSTGGRLSITQVRSNFQGKMLNDADDPAWLGGKLNELVANETLVVVVIRPKSPADKKNLAINTIYLPITEEELAEIKRLEDQAEDI